jgi:formylglycine-generating enzyme required for sulfatase activity
MRTGSGNQLWLPMLVVLIGTLTTFSWAQDTRVVPPSFSEQLLNLPPCMGSGMPGMGGPRMPCGPQAHHEWIADLNHWRTERRIRVGYDPSRYELPALKWTQSSFIQPQMMVHDRAFYDPVQNKYTVDRYLDDLDKRYGGIDSVLVWATYPNMGIDDRNEIDMVRSMPGGVDGLKKMVADFHRRGVRVLFPMMMWDQGTRDPGRPWPEAIADFMKELDADGINGDTQDGVPLAFSTAADKAGHSLAFEPEVGLSDEAISWDVFSWGYYFRFQTAPQVDRFRWLETRHMIHVCDRWNKSKVDDLQYAFFNGEGWESWENIWGIWNGITPRDSEAVRRVSAIERAFASFLVSPEWEPMYPMLRQGMYASRWPQGEQTLWTIVNRDNYDVDGRQMSIPYKPGMRFFDIYRGVELQPTIEADQAVLSFTTEAHGYGAVLSTTGEPSAAIQQLMHKMKEMTAKPLSSFSQEWQAIPQTLVEIPATERAHKAPEGMVRVDGGKFTFEVEGIEIEGENDTGVDVQYAWENSPRRYHEHVIDIAPFYMDMFPVTNAEFKKFLDSSHYHPKDDLNFLKDWKNETYPDGFANKPVTWVSLEDARAYAQWARKRLPHEWEWQYAAEGRDGRAFPWGYCDWTMPAMMGGAAPCSAGAEAVAPTPDKGRIMAAAADVNAHPKGASPFGVMDMVGNVWQWTDEYRDEHTRAAILRGGSHYQPQGSMWYFPQAYRNNQHGKLLLMAPSYDRSGAVGFRCVKDAD